MSIEAPFDDTSIFGKIIKGEAPCVKLFEDDSVLAFMDIFPQSEGHSLVIPKNASAATIFDINADDLHALIDGTQRLAKGVKAALSPDGIRIAQFNGAPAGQTVFHIHFHVIPVYGAAAERPHAAGGPADTGALETLAEKIRAHL